MELTAGSVEYGGGETTVAGAPPAPSADAPPAASAATPPGGSQ